MGHGSKLLPHCPVKLSHRSEFDLPHMSVSLTCQIKLSQASDMTVDMAGCNHDRFWCNMVIDVLLAGQVQVLVASSGDVADCNQLNTPPPPLPSAGESGH